MILIISSAIYLSLGFENYSNLCATLGFYSLAVGVFLQIASYLVYGNIQYIEQSPAVPPVKRFEFTRKYKIIAIIVTVSFLSAGVAVLSVPASIIPVLPIEVTSSSSTQTSLHASIFLSKVLPEPENQTLVAFGVNPNGASPPYT